MNKDQAKGTLKDASSPRSFGSSRGAEAEADTEHFDGKTSE